MPTINFSGGDDVNSIVPLGSGTFDTLAFMGAGGYGFSVVVGSYQDNSYSSNSDGTEASGAVPNLKYASATGAYVGTEETASPLSGASGSIQCGESTLHIQFDSSDIGNTEVQNVFFRAYQTPNINSAPSGCTVRAFELKGDASGASESSDWNEFGDSTWTTLSGSGSMLQLGDQAWPSDQKDFYIGLTASPDSIGAKSGWAMLIELEYA